MPKPDPQTTWPEIHPVTAINKRMADIKDEISKLNAEYETLKAERYEKFIKPLDQRIKQIEEDNRGFW